MKIVAVTVLPFFFNENGNRDVIMFANELKHSLIDQMCNRVVSVCEMFHFSLSKSFLSAANLKMLFLCFNKF